MAGVSGLTVVAAAATEAVAAWCLCRPRRAGVRRRCPATRAIITTCPTAAWAGGAAGVGEDEAVNASVIGGTAAAVQAAAGGVTVAKVAAAGLVVVVVVAGKLGLGAVRIPRLNGIERSTVFAVFSAPGAT